MKVVISRWFELCYSPSVRKPDGGGASRCPMAGLEGISTAAECCISALAGNYLAVFSFLLLMYCLNSEKVIPLVSAAIFSFTARKNFTVSNSFSFACSLFFILYNVFW